MPPEVSLVGVERPDPLQHLVGEGRWAGDGSFVERTADMRPEGELDLALVQRAIAAIAIHLQSALEPGEVFDRPVARAVNGVEIDCRRMLTVVSGRRLLFTVTHDRRTSCQSQKYSSTQIWVADGGNEAHEYAASAECAAQQYQSGLWATKGVW